MKFGDRPTIFANVTCHNCGQDLRQAAGEKLVEKFADVPTAARNRQLLIAFIGLIVGVPLLALVTIWAGVQLGWWGNAIYTTLAGLPLLVFPVIFWFNWQVHGIRHRCLASTPFRRAHFLPPWKRRQPKRSGSRQRIL
jgi:hypothetical protein